MGFGIPFLLVCGTFLFGTIKLCVKVDTNCFPEASFVVRPLVLAFVGFSFSVF